MMNKFNDLYIQNYFESRNWKLIKKSKLFNYYSPPIELNLPSEYFLELPINNHNSQSYDNYISRLINELDQIIPFDSSSDDLNILFSKQNSILRYRVFDSDSVDGTISFKSHIESLDAFRKTLSQAVTFVTTNKPIFGDSVFEVETYLNKCRALQTEKGSYVTKIEIPNDKIYSSFSEFNTSIVNNKLFDVLDFIKEEIFETKTIVKIDEKYIDLNNSYINFELLQSIRDIYSRTNFNNIEYQLSSNNHFRSISTSKVQPRIKSFNVYLRDLKNVLLKIIPLEVTGYIKKLASPSPLKSKKNEITIDVEIANNKETIKIILKSKDYLEAVEAHGNEWAIFVKGKAIQGKYSLTINEPEEFRIIKNTK